MYFRFHVILRCLLKVILLTTSLGSCAVLCPIICRNRSSSRITLTECQQKRRRHRYGQRCDVKLNRNTSIHKQKFVTHIRISKLEKNGHKCLTNYIFEHFVITITSILNSRLLFISFDCNIRNRRVIPWCKLLVLIENRAARIRATGLPCWITTTCCASSAYAILVCFLDNIKSWRRN